MLSFILTVCGVFFSGTWFSVWTWERFCGFTGPKAWLAIPYILSGIFIGAVVAGLRHSSLLHRWSYRVAAVWLGFLNFFLFAAFGCWIALGISKLAGLGWAEHNIAAALYGAAVVAGMAGLANASWLRVTRRTALLTNLPAAWHGRDVLLMTDLHLGNMRRAAFARKIVNTANSLKPHAVFICGDLFDGPKADFAGLVAPVRDLAAPAGIFYVTGNHEEFSDRNKYISAVRQAGVRVLHNEKVTVEGLQIVGVHDGETTDPEYYKEILRGIAVDRKSPSILLAHRPSNLSVPEEAGVSLQISGHTHKGQFWPWCWVIFWVHGPFAYGLNMKGNMAVITSSGAGTWGPPMRLGTRSEIVLIRLEKAN